MGRLCFYGGVFLALMGGAAVARAETAPAPAPVARSHVYTLAECLRLADRNHPNIWAARARLAGYHAQLDEAHWAPFWQFRGDATLSSIQNIANAAPYTSEKPDALNTSFRDGFHPWFHMGVNGGIPLYTFGKITWIGRAAEDQVRLGEWETEAARQQTRMDVRRAYYGVLLARNARMLFHEVLSKLETVIDSIKTRLSKGESGLDETDQTRLEIFQDDLTGRANQPDKGEAQNLSALRFMTGVQTDFDVPDEPLVRPSVAIGPVVTYLEAARLFRPDVNRARSGIAARRALVEFARAKLFPDTGIGMFAGYSIAPSATLQNGWVSNPFNSNGAAFGAGLGLRWTPDIMPGAARVAAAEAQLEEVRAINRMALGGVAVEVESAYGNMLDAQNREHHWGHAEQLTKKWMNDVQGDINLRRKQENDIMEALRLYFDARMNHLYAITDYAIALSDLARVTGWDAAAPSQ